MTRIEIRIHHNQESRFMPYEDGQQLQTAASHHLEFAPGTGAPQIADWAFRTFNADLDVLEQHRGSACGELAFLAACVYRLSGLRSMSVGDVVEVITPDGTQWLACEPHGWRDITGPTGLRGNLPGAATIYERAAKLRGSR